MQNIERKILSTVRETVAAYRMLNAGDSVLVAVSGGPDSVVLAHVMIILAKEYSLRLGIAHLNHCLRKEAADSDADFVADFARRLNLACFIEKKDVRALQRISHLSLEEAARKVRYDFYDQIAAKYGFNKIALGHHSNDNAELLLMNLLRGSGPLGLSGISPVRTGRIVRPLIRVKRSEIIAYISEKNLPHVTDASNSDLTFRRNRIRHQLIPELENNYNPRIIETLNRLSVILRDEEQWIEDLLRPTFNQCVSVKAPETIILDLNRFDKLASAAKRRILRKAIFEVKKDLRRITLPHVDAVLTLIGKGPVNGCLNLPERIRVHRDAATLTITRIKRDQFTRGDNSKETLALAYRYTIDSPGLVFIKEANASIMLTEIGMDDLPDFKNTGKHLAFFDRDGLQFPLVVRNVRPGDRFSPLGVNGTQTVKKYFSNHKISGDQRTTCPLLLCGDTIIWLVGHRVDNCVKVGPRTRRILKAELLLA
ncbi:MAG: tRNA lysidine(34) synthetase TilS [Desulfobacterales bacterium]|nr:MAG: tRNA lysidine(34) synthetase TilS [Desulfobacterales bacterium]